MFKSLRLLAIFVPLIVSAQIALDSAPSEEKIYIQLSDLIFDEAEIWFRQPMAPGIVGTTALQVDSGGYYTTIANAIHNNSCPCPICGYPNETPLRCKNCGWPNNLAW